MFLIFPIPNPSQREGKQVNLVYLDPSTPLRVTSMFFYYTPFDSASARGKQAGGQSVFLLS